MVCLVRGYGMLGKGVRYIWQGCVVCLVNGAMLRKGGAMLRKGLCYI